MGIELPGLLAEIEDVAGRSAAVTIAACYGGTTREFPTPRLLEQNPAQYADNWLVQTVGNDLALKIVAEIFPIGGRAEIPSAQAALRRQFIIENSACLTVPEMATFLNMTERGVRRVRQLLRAEGLLA